MSVFIPTELYLGVTNKCQLTCENCCTKQLREENPSYDLSAIDLNKLLLVTLASRYKFNEIVIIGLGEPTLWNNLEEGLSLFFKHSADVTNKVSLVTNGYDLDRLAPFIGKGLDTVYLSLYPETYDFLIDKGTEFKNEYPNNFVFNYEGCRALFGDDNMLSNFFVYTDPKRKIQFDGECECPGPMYNDGYIYPLCGKAVSVSLFESHPYIRKAPFVNYLAGTYFLDSDNEKAICTIPACNYCRCNTGGYAGKQPLVAPHRMSGVVSES